MRFKLELREHLGGERLLLNIVSIYPRCYGEIQGIIDTGSPCTILSAGDVIKLNIPIKNLKQAPALSGFGRGGLPSKELNNFKFYLKDEIGKPRHFINNLLATDISTLSKMSHEFKINASRVPTIIGLDFLKELKMKLVSDFIHNEFYLEKED